MATRPSEDNELETFQVRKPEIAIETVLTERVVRAADGLSRAVKMFESP